MSIAFSGEELIDIAIGIEREGIAFYDTMALSTSSAETARLFKHLANMERHHLEVFEEILTKAGGFEISPGYDEESVAYLRELIQNAVFTDELASSEMVNSADSDIKALELAVGAEKDSILFYYELKDILPQTEIGLVDSIITEEKRHLRQLTSIKNQLKSQ